MPSFFTFQQGNDSCGPVNDSSPLLGRYRAVPDQRRQNRRRSSNNLLGSFRRSGLWGYDAVFGNGDDSSDDGDLAREDMGRFRRWGRTQKNLWLEPKQADVAKLMERWWSRWAVLVFLPAALAVAWCALPIPQYPLPDDDDLDVLAGVMGHKAPGHGEARVEINFWFFLFVYYGFYNITALIWVTKVFNIYSLNWWPETLGFPVTVSMIAALSIAVPIPIYCFPELRYFTTHNTAWICWTFFTMAMPLLLACAVLLYNERHLGLRQSLSETQRIFTTSWWTGDTETLTGRDRVRRPHIQHSCFDPHASLEVALATDNMNRLRVGNVAQRKRWIPASFMRFIWFCAALYIAMMAYVLGEAYAEIYLRTLPHDTFQTIVYVYTWVVTVHLLDWLTGWILGGNEGERVGSYPLGWIFKLYYSLTYQTYVRALYARLRSPHQFLLLQIISSTGLIILGPLTMSAPFHYVLSILSINGQSLQTYQKYCARNIYIRSLAECVSMTAFLGSILVLHYGSNKEVYPYFSFDPVPMNNAVGGLPSIPIELPGGSSEVYDFNLTFYASVVTFGCEIVAAWIVRRIISFGWNLNITREAKEDLGRWPELLPTGIVVMVHVLQNMLFSIIRLRFH